MMISERRQLISSLSNPLFFSSFGDEQPSTLAEVLEKARRSSPALVRLVAELEDTLCDRANLLSKVKEKGEFLQSLDPSTLSHSLALLNKTGREKNAAQDLGTLKDLPTLVETLVKVHNIEKEEATNAVYSGVREKMNNLLGFICHRRDPETAEWVLKAASQFDKNYLSHKAFGFVIAAFFQKRNPMKAQQLFQFCTSLLPNDNVDLHNALMQGYSRVHRDDDVQKIFKEIQKKGFKMTKETFLPLMASYGRLQKYDELKKTWEAYLESLPPLEKIPENDAVDLFIQGLVGGGTQSPSLSAYKTAMEEFQALLERYDPASPQKLAVRRACNTMMVASGKVGELDEITNILTRIEGLESLIDIGSVNAALSGINRCVQHVKKFKSAEQKKEMRSQIVKHFQMVNSKLYTLDLQPDRFTFHQFQKLKGNLKDVNLYPGKLLKNYRDNILHKSEELTTTLGNEILLSFDRPTHHSSASLSKKKKIVLGRRIWDVYETLTEKGFVPNDETMAIFYDHILRTEDYDRVEQLRILNNIKLTPNIVYKQIKCLFYLSPDKRRFSKLLKLIDQNPHLPKSRLLTAVLNRLKFEKAKTIPWASIVLNNLNQSGCCEQKALDLYLEICMQHGNGSSWIEKDWEILGKGLEKNLLSPRGIRFLIKFWCQNGDIDTALARLEDICEFVEEEERGKLQVESDLGDIADATLRVIDFLLQKEEKEIEKAEKVFQRSLSVFKRVSKEEEGRMILQASARIVKGYLRQGKWDFARDLLMKVEKDELSFFSSYSFHSMLQNLLMRGEEELAMEFLKHGSKLGVRGMVGDGDWEGYQISSDD